MKGVELGSDKAFSFTFQPLLWREYPAYGIGVGTSILKSFAGGHRNSWSFLFYVHIEVLDSLMSFTAERPRPTFTACDFQGPSCAL